MCHITQAYKHLDTTQDTRQVGFEGDIKADSDEASSPPGSQAEESGARVSWSMGVNLSIWVWGLATIRCAPCTHTLSPPPTPFPARALAHSFFLCFITHTHTDTCTDDLCIRTFIPIYRYMYVYVYVYVYAHVYI